MNYELAKSLKDAGFPQNFHGSGDWFDDETGEPSPEMLLSSRRDFDLTKCSYVPTLEELITAVGKPFGGLEVLSYGEAKWGAYTFDGETAEVGASPGETVARLWLALHKK